MTSTPVGDSGALPDRWAGLEERVPASLEDLRGPAEGTVTLPLHLAWSGPTEFPLDEQLIRVSLYQAVITTGQRVDAERYLNAGRLIEDWPLLRRLLGRAYRWAWEARLPQLSRAGQNI